MGFLPCGAVGWLSLWAIFYAHSLRSPARSSETFRAVFCYATRWVCGICGLCYSSGSLEIPPENFASRCRGHGSTASAALRAQKIAPQSWSLIFTAATASLRILKFLGNFRLGGLRGLAPFGSRGIAPKKNSERVSAKSRHPKRAEF